MSHGEPDHAGRLLDGAVAPARGERSIPLGGGEHFAVEQILSGRLDAPLEYVQDHDEWVVVLQGRARLVVDGAERTMEPGDWQWLPAGRPHTLALTEPGTSWLAVRGPTEER